MSEIVSLYQSGNLTPDQNRGLCLVKKFLKAVRQKDGDTVISCFSDGAEIESVMAPGKTLTAKDYGETIQNYDSEVITFVRFTGVTLTQIDECYMRFSGILGDHHDTSTELHLMRDYTIEIKKTAGNWLITGAYYK